jgi:selenocysteine-specific elongation factor
MKSACVIVIGHVDHGKTTLVRALTGMETDTLEQEKQRGLSINLGFAYCRYPSGTIDLIDAPGHEDFIRAMVAGATGAQAAILVISAVDGVAPQTIEHLRIAMLLAVPVRFIALTKTDLIPSEGLENQISDIRSTLSQLGVSGISLIPVSPQSQTGHLSLHEGLENLLSEDSPPNSPYAAFLPIDRVFTAAGRGTVVTGTLLGADLALSGTVVLHPKNQPLTIRGLQSRGEDQARVKLGARVAVNLRGVASQHVARGDVLCADGQFASSDCVDIELTLLGYVSRPLKHMSTVRVLVGTSHAVATVRLMGERQVAPGQRAFGQLRFSKPVTAFAGQRMILRSLSPPETIGGAEVLDPWASSVKSGDAARLAVMRAAVTEDIGKIAKALCEQGQGVALLADVTRLGRQSAVAVSHGITSEVTFISEGLIAMNQSLAAEQAGILQKLAAFHATYPLKRFAPRTSLNSQSLSPKLTAYVLGVLENDGSIRLDGDQIALEQHDPWQLLTQNQLVRIAEIEARLKVADVMPPDFQTLTEREDDHDLLNLLVMADKVVALFNVALKQRLVFHQSALQQAAQTLRVNFPPPMLFTTGEAREVLKTSRKFIVPLLEYFDAQGITLRQGNVREMTKPS